MKIGYTIFISCTFVGIYISYVLQVFKRKEVIKGILLTIAPIIILSYVVAWLLGYSMALHSVAELRIDTLEQQLKLFEEMRVDKTTNSVTNGSVQIETVEDYNYEEVFDGH